MYPDNEVGDQRLSERFDLEVSAAKSFSNIFMIVNDRMLLNHLTTSGIVFISKLCYQLNLCM